MSKQSTSNIPAETPQLMALIARKIAFALSVFPVWELVTDCVIEAEILALHRKRLNQTSIVPVI